MVRHSEERDPELRRSRACGNGQDELWDLPTRMQRWGLRREEEETAIQQTWWRRMSTAVGKDDRTNPATLQRRTDWELTTLADRQRLRPASTEEECKDILYYMEWARSLQLCRSTVVALPSAQCDDASFLTSWVHLITLPMHSRWLKCCLVIPTSLTVLHLLFIDYCWLFIDCCLLVLFTFYLSLCTFLLFDFLFFYHFTFFVFNLYLFFDLYFWYVCFFTFFVIFPFSLLSEFMFVTLSQKKNFYLLTCFLTYIYIYNTLYFLLLSFHLFFFLSFFVFSFMSFLPFSLSIIVPFYLFELSTFLLFYLFTSLSPLFS